MSGYLSVVARIASGGLEIVGRILDQLDGQEPLVEREIQ